MAMIHRVRAASVDDIEFMIRLEQKTCRTYFENVSDWTAEYQREHFYAYFKPKYVSIIQDDSQLMGAFSFFSKKNVIFILYVYLLPEFQGQGIGTFILKGIIRMAKAQGKPIVLNTFKKNTKALRLFIRLGFKVIHESENKIFLKRS